MDWAYFRMGEYGEAEKNLQKAIQLDGSLWQAHHLLGIIYDRERKLDTAVHQYRTAINLKPNMSVLFNNLGMSLLLSGEYEEAVKSFTEALKLEPSNSKIHNN